MFPLQNGGHCNEVADGGHTIQRSILESMSTCGHVKSFSRNPSDLKRRFVEHETEESKAFFGQRQWSASEVGVDEASVNYFSCNAHDIRMFRPVEHAPANEEDHPLANPPYTPEQYFLLAYRISMMYIEQLERVKQMTMSVSNNPTRDNRILAASQMIGNTLKIKKEEKALFDKCYLKADFKSLIQTPVSIGIELPLRIAVADTYAFARNTSMGEVFLTILPFGQTPLGDRDMYFHRVFVSHITANEPHYPATVEEIERMIDSDNKEYGGHSEFLREVMSYCRNSFFSFEYDGLPVSLRNSVEQAVRKVETQFLPREFQHYF